MASAGEVVYLVTDHTDIGEESEGSHWKTWLIVFRSDQDARGKVDYEWGDEVRCGRTAAVGEGGSLLGRVPVRWVTERLAYRIVPLTVQ